MRAGGAVSLALLLIAILATKVLAGDDIYLDDQDGDINEYLEVKEQDVSHGRTKRNWWNSFFPAPTTAAPENIESITEDQDDSQDNLDYDGHSEGSGAEPVSRSDPNPREKTLRVSFVVMEPFLDDYSNRDSELFQTFSHSLADAVNKLFEDQPGTQKASLVRIQSRPADNFSCKVTLDIVTTADDTDRMADKLRVHIRNTRTLGAYTLTDTDFSANVVTTGSSFELCRADELECTDGQCFPGTARCDGARDCSDGVDERDCPGDATNEQTEQNPDDTNQVETSQPRCVNETLCRGSVDQTICPEDFCNGIKNCPDGEDESPERCESRISPDHDLDRGDQPFYQNNLDTETTTIPTRNEESPRVYRPEIDETACLPGEFRCDVTRCVSKELWCNKQFDCVDGSDEAKCSTGGEVQKVLKNLRDTHYKIYIKKIPNIYMRVLSFLLNQKSVRGTTNNIKPNSTRSAEDLMNRSNEDSHTDQQNIKLEARLPKKTKHTQKNTDDELINLLQKKYDEDISFSEMLVPMLKNLSTEQKHYAKVEILNVFKRASNLSPDTFMPLKTPSSPGDSSVLSPYDSSLCSSSQSCHQYTLSSYPNTTRQYPLPPIYQYSISPYPIAIRQSPSPQYTLNPNAQQFPNFNIQSLLPQYTPDLITQQYPNPNPLSLIPQYKLSRNSQQFPNINTQSLIPQYTLDDNMQQSPNPNPLSLIPQYTLDHNTQHHPNPNPQSLITQHKLDHNTLQPPNPNIQSLIPQYTLDHNTQQPPNPNPQSLIPQNTLDYNTQQPDNPNTQSLIPQYIQERNTQQSPNP